MINKEPKTNSVTHISCLITGDCFYCHSDEKKTVWELRFHTMVKIRGQLKKLSQCVNDNGERCRFDANRVVVFLRRTRPQVKRVRIDSLEKYFV